MVTLFLIYAIISGAAGLRGYKSPLFGVAGIVLYFLFGFPAVRMMPDSSEYVQGIAAAVAAIGCVSFVVFQLPLRHPRAEPKESHIPYAFLGAVCLVLSCCLGASWIFFLIAGSAEANVLLLSAGLLLTGALACFRFHKQQTLPSASESLALDTRPPVLFLRSFQSDAERVKPWGSGMLPMYPDFLGKSFEEFLAPAMNKIGPFIALGNPDDYLPTLGASKVYERDDVWRATVLDYLERAKFVIVHEGSSAGLNWELGQIRKRCSPRAVFLVTPTRKFSRTSWGEFAKLLEGAGFEVPSTDVGPGAVVGFDGLYHPTVLLQGATRAEEYSDAIQPVRTEPREPNGDREGTDPEEARAKICPGCGRQAINVMARRCRVCGTEFGEL
jgi:hypothetical protein